MDRSKLHERRFEFQTRSVVVEGGGAELWAEGYAVRFSSPTVLYEIDGIEYREQIEPGAFEGCKMNDVIFNYNHCGKVMARTRNRTLQLTVDDVGLFIRARLDGTEEGRRMYDEISKGYVDRMSFRFDIRQEEFNVEKRMWTVQKLKQLVDVSAVDLPAYDDTYIEARKADAEAVARSHRQAVDTALLRKQLELRLKII